MLRRTNLRQNLWAKYRFPHAAVPKGEGPPPLDAPKEMNRSKKNPNVDPIDDPFPRAIRGDSARPDVPDKNYVPQWYFLYTTNATGELFPWTSTAPEGNFRFRPHNAEFGTLGRETVESMKSTDRLRLPDGSYKNPQLGAAGNALPNREQFLTKMMSSPKRNVNYNKTSTSSSTTSQNNINNMNNNNNPSPTTVMNRALKERYQKVKHLTPLQKQFDVGRNEPIPYIAGQVPVDKSQFPYKWNMDDWYEYEISKVRMQRFKYENSPNGNLFGPSFSSEVTYKVILAMDWQHHIDPFAEDVCSFLREVGRQIIEEKLTSVRNSLLAIRKGVVDPELRAAYNLSTTSASNSNSLNLNSSEKSSEKNKTKLSITAEYSDDEIRMQQQRELEQLETECVHTLGLINSSQNNLDQAEPGSEAQKDLNSTWPVIEEMEPWKRMVEFWGERGDTTFAQAEMSTRKFEFRKFFRVLKIKMPFQSTEFEKRMYDTRHWAHRGGTLEYHTIHKKNLMHDSSLFPVEHDAVEKTSHEHHRLFSFALDWQSAPANFMTTTEVNNNTNNGSSGNNGGESCQEICERLGCTFESLVLANNNNINEKLESPKQILKPGTILNIPSNATKRLTSTSVLGKKLLLSSLSASNNNNNDGSTSSNSKTWKNVARHLNCTIEELQAANGHALSTYNDKDDCFSDNITELHVPSSVLAPAVMEGFSDVEPTFVNDTFEDIAQRIGCNVEQLKNANPDLDDPAKVTNVKVPSEAQHPRRRSDSLLRTTESADELFTKLKGEMDSGDIPSTIPHQPDYASQFPGEFADGSGAYPQNPNPLAGMDDWITYTAMYLDQGLSLKSEPQPRYNVNRVWPAQAVPGTLQQEPFSEDQTWLLHRIPMHTHEVVNPESEHQGLPEVNHEQYSQSMEWRAP